MKLRGGVFRRPKLTNWRKWKWEDYLVYFLSIEGIIARLREEPSPAACLTPEEFSEFCRPIRERLSTTVCADSPRVSIQMPARNDEYELLATLVSYTLLDVKGVPVELIVADNASTDRTAKVIRQCGVKYAYAAEPGMGRARRAAYDAMLPSVEYVWLTDCDARVIAPIRAVSDLIRASTILQTNVKVLDARADVIALSTGIVYEWTHPLFRFARQCAIFLRKAPRVHAWAGPNQFIRRSALDAVGGIHPDVPYRSREDHQRMYELARYAKTIKANMLSAAADPALFDPVYHSGRRRATIRDVLAAFAKGRRMPPPVRDRYGYPVHPHDRIRV